MPETIIEIDAAASAASFVWNEMTYRSLLQNEVAADLAKRAIRVESAAKVNASGAPGPNVRTGRLRGSLTWAPGEENGEPYVDVGTNVEYAPYVELGTSRMSARPYLRPALEAARD